MAPQRTRPTRVTTLATTLATTLVAFLVAALTPAGSALTPSYGGTPPAAPAPGPDRATGTPPQQSSPRATRSASPPRCRGRRATLVGQRGQVLRGTRGRDVVVTSGARMVLTRGGDDLVCVTGGRAMQVHTGRGADRVVVRQGRGRVWAVLGAGPDTYRGGRATDEVYAAQTNTLADDRHRDVVATRGGRDRVVVGHPGTANADVVRLGSADDELWWYSTDNRGGRFLGGTGDDRFTYMAGEGTDPAAQWLLDTTAGTLADRGTTLVRHAGFEDYYLSGLTGESLHVAGSDRSESVTLPRDTTVSASTGGGDDRLAVYHFAAAPLRTSGPGLDGGSGRDEVSLTELSGTVVADLVTQRVSVSVADRGIAYDVPLAGIEDLTLSAYETVTITGDDGPNRLTGYSCDTLVVGAGGADELRSEGYVEDIDCARPARLLGGAGDDTLVGGRFDDLLDGGEGLDSADGAKGTDTCVAEVRRRCEA
ncbi:hypothetical protein [Nocardioides solisilvae]|uniref:hypothetical protein n=1 Tax=Nocardioides solisilvae TaxID=1542435 RepID=UPI000D746598|nr:hypothetical protein [Nocardioides solisilvae]